MGFGKKFRKRIKKVGRKVLPAVAKISSVAAPVVGAVFGGPAGAAALTAVSGAASRYTGAAAARGKGKHGQAARAAGRKASKRALITGAAITGGALAIGAVSGGGLFAPLATSVPQLFNGNPTSKDTARAGGVETPAEFAEAKTLQDALSGIDYGGRNGTGVFDGLFSLAGLNQKGVIPQGPNILEDPAGSVFRPSGGSDDGGFTLPNGAEDSSVPETGIFQNKAAWAIGGIAVLALLMKRKSG